MRNFKYVVTVTAPTRYDADTVIAERLSFDEDHGEFEYGIWYSAARQLADGTYEEVVVADKAPSHDSVLDAVRREAGA